MPNDLNAELKALIVDTLMLEDVVPEDIADDQILFGEGLGLDSVDALELAMEIERRFGVTIPNDEEGRQVFRHVAALSAYIAEHRTTQA